MMGENGIYLGFFWIFLGKNDFFDLSRKNIQFDHGKR